MKTFKTLVRWGALIIVWGNLLFLNWVSIGFTAVSGSEKYGLVLFFVDIMVAYFTLKHMGWLPQNLECIECGCTTFEHDEINRVIVCDRCKKPIHHE